MFVKELQINLNNHSLGTLVFTGRDYRFTYEATWVSSGFPLSPSLPLQSDTFISKKLFPVFVDASPGGWGQKLLQYIENLYAEIEKRTFITIPVLSSSRFSVLIMNAS